MKKNLLLRLCLMMSVILTLSSCTNEDFYSSSENNSKQEIISKSLWKEDTLFTKRIYDHFQKSFMFTEADQHKFVSEHGTPVWEYTMTMGFRRNQLFVPLIQNNTVISVMRVQRQDKKAFYSFTKDDEALAFFDVVMYNRNHDKLQPQKDEKLNENIFSKGGGATWTCTKRIVITGYHMEGDVMVMETSAMDVCKYSYTGVKPYVDHLDVYTDGMEGGGGGDESEEEEEYVGSPCEKLKNQTTDINFKNKVTDLQGKTDLKKETGYIQKADGSYTYKDAAGQSSTSNTLALPNPKLDENKNIIAYIHTHVDEYTFINAAGIEETRKGIRMFSPADMNYFMDMIRNAQDAGRSLSDVYAVMVTSTGNYQIRFTGNQYQIKSFTKQQIENFTKEFPDFMSKYSDNLELGFLNFISEKMNIKATNLYKMETDGTAKEIKMNNDKTSLTKTECPK